MRWRSGRTFTGGPRKVGDQAVQPDGSGIPLGSILLEPTLDLLAGLGDRLPCPASIQVALDAGYDSNVTRERLAARGLNGDITPKGVKVPINKTSRWVVERTNSRQSRGFGLLLV